MSSRLLEDTMNQLFQGIIPLSKAQNQRLAYASSAMTLAESVSIPKMANRISKAIHKAGRVRLLERLFQAPFLISGTGVPTIPGTFFTPSQR